MTAASAERVPTYYQEVKRKGYSRRDFIKFISLRDTCMGWHTTGIAQISNALKTTTEN